MKLSKIISDIPINIAPFEGEAEITGIVSDSRLVTSGSLFVALTGGTTDGHKYIQPAIEKGASAIVGMKPMTDLSIPYLRVPDSRKALPYLAAAFYAYPARKMTMIGVTGTDGKTTTTNLIFEILKAAGKNPGMISTINAVIGERVLDTGFHVTTPDAPDVQRYLAEMMEAGITHVVLEVTSHGLAQSRADACEFDVAVLTNITHEHLDYHGSFEAYRATKARLFSELSSTHPKAHGNPRKAILNRDDPSYAYLAGVTTGEVISYGFSQEAEIRPVHMQHEPGGMIFNIDGKGKNFTVKCSLVGDFNISNCLAAISATVYGLDVPVEAAQAGIANMKGVPGRMERIDLGQDFTAIVDFAHTPNALRVALETVRNLNAGKVIAVFGAAGLRDRQKRRMMAETSIELADYTVLTAEDPRSEDINDILAEMASGANNRGGVEGKSYWRIADRGEAIRFAVASANSGDVVICCGKGHEQSMCFGEIEYAWDDRIALRAALAGRLGIPGPKMPYLPTQER